MKLSTDEEAWLKKYEETLLECPSERLLSTVAALTINKKSPEHTCHFPSCNTPVPPKMWGCKKHWFKLPAELRNQIWATYKPGQEITKTPSEAYLRVANKVQQWCLENPD